MHYPFRVAKQGRAEDSAFQAWRISTACVDNDILLVIDDTSLPAERIRDAIAQTTAQPCAVSEVMTIGDSLDPSHPVWLIRVPAAGRADVQRWQARNGTLMIDGRRIQTRPAPPTCAKFSCQNGSDPKQLHAAQAQMTWRSTTAASTAPIYIRTRANDDEEQQEIARRLRTLVWRDPRTPGVNRIWEGLLPGIRASLQIWNAPASTTTTDNVISGLLRDTDSDCSSPSRTLSRIDWHDGTNGRRFSRILAAGDRLILHMPTEAEIQIDSATHTSKCYLPEAKYVSLGVCPSDERRHAQCGLIGDIRITATGPQPLAVWTLCKTTIAPQVDAQPHVPRNFASAQETPNIAEPHVHSDTPPNDPSNANPYFDSRHRWQPPPTIIEWLRQRLEQSQGDRSTDEESDVMLGSAEDGTVQGQVHQDAETRTI